MSWFGSRDGAGSLGAPDNRAPTAYRRMRSLVGMYGRQRDMGGLATQYNALSRRMAKTLADARQADGRARASLVAAFKGLADERRRLKDRIVRAAALKL